MLKITDKRRARYWLEVRVQGGHRLIHFVRTNKLRYIFLIGYIGAASGYMALTNQWFFFWVILAILVGILTADLNLLRGLKKSWPFMSRVLNWDEVKKVADE